MTNYNITIKQAVQNTAILHHNYAVFTTDANGNVNCISKYNILGLIFNYIKNLIEGTGEHEVNKAILATFEAIKQYSINNPSNPVWTYPSEFMGKDLDIGFDKVAMRILLDKSRFSTCYYSSPEKLMDDTTIQIRKLAYEILLMATEQRKKEKISFDCDHLKSEILIFV